jgi:hypothetical protein
MSSADTRLPSLYCRLVELVAGYLAVSPLLPCGSDGTSFGHEFAAIQMLTQSYLALYAATSPTIAD